MASLLVNRVSKVDQYCKRQNLQVLGYVIDKQFRYQSINQWVLIYILLMILFSECELSFYRSSLFIYVNVLWHIK